MKSRRKNLFPLLPPAIAVAAYYLQVDANQLGQVLMTRKIVTGIGARKDTYDTPLNPVQAAGVRDSLCKGIHEIIFDFIVGCINRALQKSPSTTMSISVLDIHRFEIFDKNGFEQFCINYVNEKLQQIFIELTLPISS